MNDLDASFACGRGIAHLQLVAGLVHPVVCRYWLTSTQWRLLAREIHRDLPDTKTSTGEPPSPENFQELKIQSLTVVNSGTEDQGVCDLLNEPEARRAQFQRKRERLISGRAA